jgi:predicted phosphodiesterase
MTTYGVLADVHGNLAALDAALGALDALGVDRIVCLGDVVGYNPGGAACVRRIEQRGVTCVAGNHDLIAIGRLGFERCADKPAHALRCTRRELDARSRTYLAALPLRAQFDGGAVALHGSPDDVSEYLHSDRSIERAAVRLVRQTAGVRVCFYGHTHEPRAHAVEARTGRAREMELSPGDIDVTTAGKIFFVNPGAVDASRRAGARTAQFAVFDAGRGRVALHEALYDQDAAERSARERGYRMGWLDVVLARASREARHGRERVARAVRRSLEWVP